MRWTTWLTIAGAIAGGIAGWLYWKYVGCINGTCYITSKPLNSTVYGAIMGALLSNIIVSFISDQKLKTKNKNNVRNI